MTRDASGRISGVAIGGPPVSASAGGRAGAVSRAGMSRGLRQWVRRVRRRAANALRLSPLGIAAVGLAERVRGSTGRTVLKHARTLERRGLPIEARAAYRWAAAYPAARRAALASLCRLSLERGPFEAEAMAALRREAPEHWETIELAGRLAIADECFVEARGLYRRALGAVADQDARPELFSYAIDMESICNDHDAALATFARAAAVVRGRESAAERSNADGGIVPFLEQRVLGLAAERIAPPGRTVVYFHDPGVTLGHAVLEPFYVRNLLRGYDRIVIVGPPLASCSAAQRAAFAVSLPGIEYVETDDPVLRLAARVNAGIRQGARVDLALFYFHGLCRAVFDARRDPAHPMHAARDYCVLPAAFAERGEAFLRRHGIAGQARFVTLHARSHRRGDWAADDVRNASIERYHAAIRWLNAQGVVVVRLGDRRSPPLGMRSDLLIDLPHLDDHDPALDPFFIQRSEFMISCQSGPCAYARALGVPTLVANSYMIFNTIPERQELLAFKTYVRTDRAAEVDAATIIAKDLLHFQFDAPLRNAGIALQELSPEQITAAAEEMLAWVAAPRQPETPSQQRFRALCAAATHPDRGAPGDLISGYVAYALPEARLSEAIARSRPDFV
jgi:putative glycosyltransferase (TIGR04372 family)